MNKKRGPTGPTKKIGGRKELGMKVGGERKKEKKGAISSFHIGSPGGPAQHMMRCHVKNNIINKGLDVWHSVGEE